MNTLHTLKISSRTIVFSFFLLSSFFILKASPAHAQGATVIREDNRCGVFDSNSTIFTTGYQAVISKSHNGNISLTCKAKDVLNTTGKVLTFNYENTHIPCVYWDGSHLHISYDWTEVLTPSGNASYVCHLNSDDILIFP
jgi:hypothetical protein